MTLKSMTGPSCCEDEENHKITDRGLNLSNHLEHWFSECGPQKTWVQSLGWEDPLEKGIVAHSSILAWRIPWRRRGAWQATVHGVAKNQT